MGFKNYLVTRFNIEYEKLYRKNDDKKEWMEERKSLFMKYCYPSIVNQNNKNFKWIIMISPETTNKNRLFFKKIQENLDIEYIEVEGWSKIENRLTEYLKENVEEGDYLATTRLDTDDMLSEDFMGNIESIFDQQDRRPISWASGYQIIKKNELEIRKVRYPSGPFKTLIEKNDGNIETVHGKMHMNWENQAEMYDDIYWGQVIHGSNVSGDKVNGIPVRKKDLKKRFGVDIKYEEKISKLISKMLNYVEMEFKRRVLDAKKKMGIE